jgi:hypothetical protein
MTPRWVLWQTEGGWQFERRDWEGPMYSRSFPDAQAAATAWFMWTGYLCDIKSLY